MFTRDIFNLQNRADSANLAACQLTTSDIVPAQHQTLSGLKGTLINRDASFELFGREAWLFVSIKNRRFNRPLVDWFIRMCEDYDLQGYVCRVDDPYKYNRMAELGIYDLPQEESEKIERLSGDIGRMVQKALNGSLTKRVQMISWRDLADDTPPAYHQELRAAFETDGLVRQALSNHVRSMKMIETEEQLNQFSEFFLAEVPVLVHAYYRQQGALDIYPGPQPDFFWQIELGMFETELPVLTNLTRQGRPMAYFDAISTPAPHHA